MVFIRERVIGSASYFRKSEIFLKLHANLCMWLVFHFHRYSHILQRIQNQNRSNAFITDAAVTETRHNDVQVFIELSAFEIQPLAWGSRLVGADWPSASLIGSRRKVLMDDIGSCRRDSFSWLQRECMHTSPFECPHYQHLGNQTRTSIK